MPLTKLGRKLKSKFIQEYGQGKGKRIFYMFEAKNKKRRLLVNR